MWRNHKPHNVLTNNLGPTFSSKHVPFDAFKRFQKKLRLFWRTPGQMYGDNDMMVPSCAMLNDIAESAEISLSGPSPQYVLHIWARHCSRLGQIGKHCVPQGHFHCVSRGALQSNQSLQRFERAGYWTSRNRMIGRCEVLEELSHCPCHPQLSHHLSHRLRYHVSPHHRSHRHGHRLFRAYISATRR